MIQNAFYHIQLFSCDLNCALYTSGWKCRRWRYGKLWCKACGCYPICKPKYCSKKICKTVLCGHRLICHYIVRYRIVKYKVKLPHYGGYYGPRYVWKVRKVPYKVKVCKKIAKYCKKCHLVTFVCGKRCRTVCKYRKVRDQAIQNTEKDWHRNLLVNRNPFFDHAKLLNFCLNIPYIVLRFIVDLWFTLISPMAKFHFHKEKTKK